MGRGEHRNITRIQSSKTSSWGSGCWTADGRGKELGEGIWRSRKPHGRDDRAVLDSVPWLSGDGLMIPMKCKDEVWIWKTAWLNWGQKVEGTAETGGMGAWEIMGTSERFPAVRDVLTLLDLTTACAPRDTKMEAGRAVRGHYGSSGWSGPSCLRRVQWWRQGRHT